MRYAKIEDGKVVRIHLVQTGDLVECPDETAVGASYDGSTFTAPAGEPVETRRSSMSAPLTEWSARVVEAGIVPETEMVAWMQTGTLPSKAASALSGAPLRDRMKAIRPPDTVHRTDGVVEALGAAYGVSAADLDALFEG